MPFLPVPHAPHSVMAQEWCIAYGVLPSEEAEKVYKVVCKRKGVKPSESVRSTPVKKATPAKRKTSKSKVIDEDADGATGRLLVTVDSIV